MMFNLLLLCLTVFATLFSIASAQEDSLNLVSLSKLPSVIYDTASFYDGYDTIYLFGGKNSIDEPTSTILRYRITSGIIEYVGELPSPSFGASLQSDSRGHLWYFGGGPTANEVYTYDPVTNFTRTIETTFTLNYSSASSLKYNSSSNLVHLIGAPQSNGDYNVIVSYDIETLSDSTHRTTLATDFKERGSSWVGEGMGLVFAERTSSINAKVARVNLTSFAITLGPADLPLLKYDVSAVFDGTSVYAIGGWEHTSGTHTDGIIKLNPQTFSHTWVQVHNFPVEWYDYFTHPPEAVYVEKLDRIYLFGGRSFNFDSDQFVLYDDIWYIDLNPAATTQTMEPSTPEEPSTTPEEPSTTPEEPSTTPEEPSTTPEEPSTTPEKPPTTPFSSTTLNPDIFTCQNRTDGIYPHPSDCAKFIICLEEIVEVYDCPPPLLFDPLLGTCHWPDDVDCSLTCLDKPNGAYPHPHDCSLFIDCHDGILDVFQCPPPLLFDPVELKCNLPHLVDCA